MIVAAEEPGSLDAVGDALARALLCEQNQSPGCTCRSCGTSKDAHPDYVRLQPSPKTISREAVREAVATLAAGPLWSPAKVVVITEANTLGRAAESYLLKHLEEPPPYVFYLLLTYTPDAIMPTIRSRCQLWSVGNRIASPPRSMGMREEFRSEPLTADRIVQAVTWVRVQYHKTARREWLSLWETLENVQRELDANGNEELARARVLRAWPISDKS